MPAFRQSSVTSHRALTSSETLPTKKVQALSPTQPLTVAPVSMEMMSPSFMSTRSDGMPCTISSFTDAQMLEGKP